MERTVGPCSPSVTSCRTTHTLEVRAQSCRGFVLSSSAAVKGTGLHNNLSKSDNAAGKKGGKIPHEIRQCTEVGDRATGLSEVSDSEKLWMLYKVQPGAVEQEMEFGLLIVVGQEQLQAGPSCWGLAKSAPVRLGHDALVRVS